MTGTRTLTVKANSQHWGAGPGTPISRTASEQALARMGWKSVSRKANKTITECRELLSSNRWTPNPTPAVWMHSSSCTCAHKPLAANNNTISEDEILASKISSAAETFHTEQQPSSRPHPRQIGLISLSRYFTFAAAASPPKPSISEISGLITACTNLDIDSVIHSLFTNPTKVLINTANALGTTPLLAAIASPRAPVRPKSHLAMVEFLLGCGADANMGTQSTSPLTASVVLGMVEVLKALVRYGGDVDRIVGSGVRKGLLGGSGGMGMAPVHVAVFADRSACLGVLLQNDARVDARFEAALSICPPRPEVAVGLGLQGRKRGGDLQHGNGYGQPLAVKSVTALHLAHSSPDCTAMLLRYGAQIGMKDSRGRTPLHWAVGSKSLSVVERLVAARADGDIPDEDGLTPLGIAMGTSGTQGIEMGRVILAGRSSDVTGSEMRAGDDAPAGGREAWV